MDVCPPLKFDDVMLIDCIGNDFYIFCAFDFYTILLSIYCVMYVITTMPEGNLL